MLNTIRYAAGMKRQCYSGSPLTNDQIATAVPAVLAAEPHESRSERFQMIPTLAIIDGLRKEGFEPFMAAQGGSRIPGKANFTRHMVRMRHPDARDMGEHPFEIVLTNAADGTSAYKMFGGCFRMVCANGLISGDIHSQIKVRHSGNPLPEVIEGAFNVIEDRDRIASDIESFRSTDASGARGEAFAEAAHVLRFGEDGAAGLEPSKLLAPRRSEDRGTDLWTRFNVAQEHIIRGGDRYWRRNERGQMRRATTRPVNNIAANETLNRALWTLANRFAELAG